MLSIDQANRPLSDVRVLDMAHHAGGSYGGMLMARLGAEVIKVERPGEGDALREMGAFRDAPNGRLRGSGFLCYNHGKKSITINFKDERGRELIRKLAKVSDVLWQNFTPGTLDGLGLGYAAIKEVNPRLIYASMSGYGIFANEGGPYWARPMLDLVAQALGGVMDATGDPNGPPTLCGPNIGDLVSALFLAYGVLGALHMRERTGEGCHVDVGMVDAMIAMSVRPLTQYMVTGKVPPRGKDDRLAPWGSFKTADGYMVIACSTQAIWERFCNAIGRADLIKDPRLLNGKDRSTHLEDVLRPAIEGWLADKQAREAAEILTRANVPAGAINTPKDILAWDQVEARHMMFHVEDPVLGPIRVPGNPVKYNGISKANPIHAPLLGEHTDEVLRTVAGLTDDEIQSMRRDGVI